MKRFFLIILFLLISAGFAYSTDNTGDINKDNSGDILKGKKSGIFKPGFYEFGIGGAYSTFTYRNSYGHNFSANFIFNHSIGKYYMIGVSAMLGFDMDFSFFYPRIEALSIYSNIRMINKFGDHGKKGYFYTEIGFDLIGSFYLPNRIFYGSIDNYDRFYAGLYVYALLMGPSLFLGFQKVPSEKFTLIIGGNFSYLPDLVPKFALLPDSNSPGGNTITQVYLAGFRVGVETRFLFRIEKSNKLKNIEITENAVALSIQVKSDAQGDLYINHEFIRSMEEGEEFVYDKLYSGNIYVFDLFYFNTLNDKKKLSNKDSAEINVKSNESYILNFNLTKSEIETKYWKRHYFELSGGGGFVYNKVKYFYNKRGDFSNTYMVEKDDWNGAISINIGYIYGINKYIGIGAGVSGVISIPMAFYSGFAVLASIMAGTFIIIKLHFFLI